MPGEHQCCTVLGRREIPFPARNKTPASPVFQPATSTEGSKAREQEVTQKEHKKRQNTQRDMLKMAEEM